MKNSRNHALRESLLEELQTEIEMARAGQIPPSWQYERQQDLKRAVELHWITEQESKDLWAQLEAALRSTRQISDREADLQAVADSRGNILYRWSGKGDSMVLTERDGDGYTAVVYLDAQALGAEAEACVKQCAKELQEYAAAHGFVPETVTGEQCRALCPPGHIATREAAFGYALTMLRSYAELHR